MNEQHAQHEVQRSTLQQQRADMEDVIKTLRDTITEREASIRALDAIVKEHEALAARSIAAFRGLTREPAPLPRIPFLQDMNTADPMLDTFVRLQQDARGDVESIDADPLHFHRTAPGLRQWVAEIPGHVRYIIDWISPAHGLAGFFEASFALTDLREESDHYLTLKRPDGSSAKYNGLAIAARYCANHATGLMAAREVQP